MKEQLAFYEAATIQMQEKVDILAGRKMNDSEAMRFIIDVLAGKDVKAEDLSTRNGNIVKAFSICTRVMVWAQRWQAQMVLHGALLTLSANIQTIISTPVTVTTA